MSLFKKIPKSVLLKAMRLWPPFLGAGIRVAEASSDFRYLKVEMPLTKMNTNYVGVHYGGSLYSMTDPWYMLMLMDILGREYVVWDKAATIRFRKPGKGKVWAEFKIEEVLVESIKRDVDQHGKTERELPVQIYNSGNEVVAEVMKVIWIGKKR